MNRWLRLLSMLLAATSAALLLSSCGENRISVSASFDDVGDLAVGAPVTMADIEVGKVSSIKLAGDEAVVTMELDKAARVPTEATARIRRTSVLGERIVDIVLPERVTSAVLRDGDHIADTTTRTDLEDLVEEGADVLGAISAGQLAVVIEEGAKGFGGRGTELGNLLSNYKDI
ncbi:MAG: MCE family protein, partial [Actinobacteria bacterium]|nr:MCE family protein [Actinomycetota bacterium]